MDTHVHMYNKGMNYIIHGFIFTIFIYLIYQSFIISLRIFLIKCVVKIFLKINYVQSIMTNVRVQIVYLKNRAEICIYGLNTPTPEVFKYHHTT